MCLGNKLRPFPTVAANVVRGDDEAAPGTTPAFGPVPVTVTLTGSAVLGVTYPPSILAGGVTLPSAAFESPRMGVAPSGCFTASWVPTAADVKTTTASAASAAAAAMTAQDGGSDNAMAAAVLSGLGARARAAFSESAAVTARLCAGGRHSLADFDTVDVLPLPQTYVGHRRNSSSEGAQRRASRSSVSVSTPPAHLVVRDSPCAVLERPLAALNDALAAQVHAGGCHSLALDEASAGGARMLDRRTVRAWFPGRVSRVRTESAARSTEAMVYWFRPTRSADGSVCLSLNCQPVSSVAALAPLGTFTVPYVPGQSVEARTLGGPWAPAEVAYADRYCLRLRVQRPPAPPSKGGRGSGSSAASFPTKVVLPSPDLIDVDRVALSSPLVASQRRGAETAEESQGLASSRPLLSPPPITNASPVTPTASPSDADASLAAGMSGGVPVPGAGRPPLPPKPPLRPGASVPPPVAAAAAAGTDIAAPSGPPSAARRPRTSSLLLGVPVIHSERDLELVPHQLWQLLLARPGHFCLRDGSSAVPAPVVTGGFGFRLFSSAPSSASATAPVAGVARALIRQGHRASFS